MELESHTYSQTGERYFGLYIYQQMSKWQVEYNYCKWNVACKTAIQEYNSNLS